MADLKIITKRNPLEPAAPSQGTNPNEYFGEQSNDLQLSTINDLATVSGVDKLRQDIQKILLTERGDNTNTPLYGTALQSLVGGKYNLDYAKAKVKDEVISGLRVLQLINQNNPNPDEQPDILESLNVVQASSDGIQVNISVITVSGKRIVTGITVPAS